MMVTGLSDITRHRVTYSQIYSGGVVLTLNDDGPEGAYRLPGRRDESVSEDQFVLSPNCVPTFLVAGVAKVVSQHTPLSLAICMITVGS